MRTDIITGQPIEVTIVLWEEYMRHLKVEPRVINDCFQRRKRRSGETRAPKPEDIVLCRIGPGEYVVTASVQIVFLHMIDSIQVMDQMPRWLPLIVKDQHATNVRRSQEVAQCHATNQPYRRRALNPVKLCTGTAIQSFQQ